MNKRIGLNWRMGGLIFLCLLMLTGISAQAAAPPEITEGATALVMDLGSGQVLYQNGAEQKMYPASTTKIMTALLVLENCDLDEIITIAPEAYRSVGEDRFGLVENEKFRAEDLLYIMLVCSSNEAAASFAVHIAGSIDGFAEMMNAKAVELGATHTHFCNPHGLQNENHYTTAADMAKIARAAMQNEEFRKIVATYQIHIDRTLPYEMEGEIQQDFITTNYLLWETASFYYPWAIGVKTGFTNDAGKCLVSAAEKDGRTLLAVVFKCSNKWDIYPVTKSLLDYGFDNFQRVEKVQAGSVVVAERQVKGGVFASVAAVAEKGFSYSSPVDGSLQLTEEVEWLEEKLEAPVLANQQLGYLVYYADEQEFGRVNLIAANPVEEKVWSAWDLIKIGLILLGIAIVLIMVYGWIRRRRRILHNRRRLPQYRD